MGIWLAAAQAVSFGGTLNGSFALVPIGSAVDLTAAGPIDWTHWGLNTEYGFDRKAAAPQMISDLNPILGFPNGSGPYTFTDNYNGYSWSDGGPNVAATNTTTGLYILYKGSGYQITVPADTVRRTLRVYVGSFQASGELDASLSDRSASDYKDTSLSNPGNGPCAVYTLDYAADSPGQTLTVTWSVNKELVNNAQANVTIQAAALANTFSNNPPSATLTSPAQNANFSAPTNIPLSAIASDSDGTVSKVEFYQGSTKLGESAGPTYSIMWSNPVPGDYLLRAVATDNGGLSYTSSPVEIFVSANQGALTGSGSSVPLSVDLTSDGNLDWAHWGLNSSSSFDHKNGVAQQIANFNLLGGGAVDSFSGYPTTFNWSDGTPTEAASTSTGVSVAGLTNGFEVVVPAASYTKTLKLYAGVYGAQGNLQAFLSDLSAPAYADNSVLNYYGNSSQLYTINFSTPSAGQSLHVRWVAQGLYDAEFGNVMLVAASLSGTVPVAPQPVTLLNSYWSNGVFTFSFATETNRTYTAEFTTSLTGGSWQVLTNVVGTGSPAIVTDKYASTGPRYYRVMIYPVPPQQPAQAVILNNACVAGGLFRFSFESEAGRAYAVQYKGSFSDGNWLTLTNVPGTGTTINISDTANANGRVYRVAAQ